MKNKKIWILLIGIVVLGSILRLSQLGNIPPSPDWDEVALGYDAYSIIHTGKDEFGKFLPVVLRSFDDYKPALYAYLVIPAILVFGLSEFAVRLPSAIFGIISIIAVFYLIRELFKDYKYKDYLSLLASFFLAISPWSIQFSRVGFESNVGDVLNILMVLFFVKGLKKPWVLILSAFFAGLGICVYQSEKVFIPLLVLALVLIFRKSLFSLNKKYIIGSITVGVIVVLPMFLFILNNKASLLRVTGTSVFSSQTEILKPAIIKLERDRVNNDQLGLILDNRRIVYAKAVISGYISHFNLNWLFLNGDISRHHAPNMGLIYLFELPFILIGIYILIFGNFDKKIKLLIFGWFLIAPIPASITTGVPHAVRTLNFIPTYQIFSALGILTSLLFVNKYRKVKYLFYLTIGCLFLFNFSYFLNQYFVQLNYYDSADWQYGYKEVVSEVTKLQDKYTKIVISDTQPMDKSYMFFLFYLKYSPSAYQKVGQSSGGFAAHQSFGKYVFRPINWQKDSNNRNILYIGPPGEISDEVSMKTIYNLDGSVAFRIAGT